ncbi:MAG: alpha/beta hydrolase [Bacteroides sp.]|jgi:pimeloyl-ACP methyl ester carboxylesterase|nr:alpha/beta hydrolase [Bacteroides sp.]
MKNFLKLIVILAPLVLFNQCKTMNPKQWHPYNDLPGLNSLNEIEYPYTVHHATLSDGRKLAYVDEGQGNETIIFIHGLGSYLPAWKKNIEGLKDDFRCIAIDLPGYGHSSKEPHSGMMSFYADVVVDFMNQLELDQAVLAGHSMGGQISMVAAMKHPERVKRLILAAPAGFERFTEGQKQWFRNVMTLRGVKLTRVEDIVSNLAYNFYELPDDAEFMITDRIAMRSAEDFDAYCHAVVESVNGMVDEPVIDHLEKITQPTLILFGEKDNLIPNRFLNPGTTAAVAQVGAEKIAKSQLVILPDTGHFLQFENPDRFNEEVISFLKPR